MNNLNNKLIEYLIDLKKNHNVIGIKTEFETEGTSFEEAEKLCRLVQSAELDFIIKIGGCGALNDILNAKKIGANTIVAPMIESSYALEKFIQTINIAYSREITKLFINIETITGINNLQNIINSESFQLITGIILGRNDLVSSMNKDKSYVNSQEILKITQSIAKEMESRNKQLIIGGCVDENSINFFNNINAQAFYGYETRKVVFKKNSQIKRESILKAIEFEILWLKNKTEKTRFDIQRINYLEKFIFKSV